jgi:hypothetical protein
MAWAVEYTDEFGEWFEGLDESEQDDIDVSVRLLEAEGPRLRHPHSSGISSSNMVT